MQIFLIGSNHRLAPLEVRERLAIAPERVEEFLQRGASLPHVEELVLLSTCNRVELYGASRHPQLAAGQLLDFLTEFQQLPAEQFSKHHYRYEGEAAVNHGFRVACSLDSMILGESQILGQVKEAYRQALTVGTTGRVLNKFFHHAFQTAKRVRSETQIAAHPVSVSYAAVVLARQIFGDLKQKRALIVGSGKMNRLAVRHLQGSGIEKIYVTNRTEAHADELAQAVKGEAIPFANFSQWLSEVDIVITSTHAPHYLIDAPMVDAALKRRKNASIFFIDLAVPRDVDPEVNQLGNVFVYDVDDLGSVVEANKETRQVEAKKAETIVNLETAEFKKVMAGFALVPTISSLAKKFEKICQGEIDRTLQKLPHLNREDHEVIEQMAATLIKKVLHDPMVTLKEHPDSVHEADVVTLVRKLFRLDEIS